MATLNLGRLKPVFRGAWNSSTAYNIDDIVVRSDESYISIQAGSNQDPASASAYWTKMAAKGSDGTDVSTTLTTQGDILYRDGSGLQRLPKGTAGQVLKMNSGATAPEYGTMSSGAFSIADIQRGEISAQTHAGATSTAYSFGPTLSTTPSASTDLIEFKMTTGIEGDQGGYYGFAIGVNTSDSWTSNTTDAMLRLNEGEHTRGMGSGSDTERYQQWGYCGIFNLTELGMSAGTQYYLKCHVLGHNPAGTIKTGYTSSGRDDRVNNFSLVRYTV